MPGLLRMRIPAVLAFALALALPASPSTFDSKAASFAVSFHGQISAFRDAALTLLPGATVTIGAVGGPAGDYAAGTRDGIVVHAFVIVPANRVTRRMLNGYRIGAYEKLPLKLEAVLERVNALGARVDTLHVTSAYRTALHVDVRGAAARWTR